MLVGMNMVIVILAMVIGYVALTACLNGILGFFVTGLTIQKSSPLSLVLLHFYSVYQAVMLCM